MLTFIEIGEYLETTQHRYIGGFRKCLCIDDWLLLSNFKCRKIQEMVQLRSIFK